MRVLPLLLVALLTTPALADPNWGQAGQVTGNSGMSAPNWAGASSTPSAHTVERPPLPRLACRMSSIEFYAEIELRDTNSVIPEGATITLQSAGYRDTAVLATPFPNAAAQNFHSHGALPILVVGDTLRWTVPASAAGGRSCGAVVSM